ncbi:protein INAPERTURATE POLLEN1 [Melia azedarach]|uniref:Protein INAPERTURATE POLLEN1 n=1 Tax=Melia azedarach TaxID=155640 RepID=A0ACC1XNB8_MELAZ|nr:protein INAPERTURATE POLLEN1 [Melia azedarach]
MPKPLSSLFSRKKPEKLAFKYYYTNWFKTLKNTLLPLIRQSLSSSSSQTLLYSHVDLLLNHFLSYYDTLDLAASQENLPQLLFPSWHNNEEDDDDEEFCGLVLDVASDKQRRPWQVLMAWKNVSQNLTTRIEQIECGLRLMVPALISRMKKLQAGFMGRVAENWVAIDRKNDGVLKEVIIGEAMKEEMEEMVSVFVDANRLRKSVITEIVGVLSAYQAALFLEGLAQFLVGFRDPELLREFERCKDSDQ